MLKHSSAFLANTLTRFFSVVSKDYTRLFISAVPFFIVSLLCHFFITDNSPKLLQLFSLLVKPIMWIPIINASLTILDNTGSQIKSLFKDFDIAHILRFWSLLFILWLAGVPSTLPDSESTFGAVLMLFGILFVAFFYYNFLFSLVIIFDESPVGIWKALSKSKELARGNFWNILIVLISLAAIRIVLGKIMWGISPFIPYIVYLFLLPVVILSLTTLYKEIASRT
jgi:hypothetical protein